MKKRALVLLFILSGPIVAASIFTGTVEPGLRVLHLDLDSDAINDVQGVSKELGWRLTSLNPLSSRQSAIRFLGSVEDPTAVYTMTHERAERIWATNWAYFLHFDLIVTSALLARIFLQQKRWDGLLIVLIPSDFDYCAQQGLQVEYYRLFERAAQMPNVHMVDISNGLR